MAVPADEVEIVPYQDGPYLVRGPAVLRDQDGHKIYAGRRTIALCRCGKSRIRPFCDGTHQLIRFKAASEPQQPRAQLNGSILSTSREAAPTSSALAASGRSIAQALSLLSAARELLAASLAPSNDGQGPDRTTPCICLLRGAIEALARDARAGMGEVSKVTEQLSGLVARLEEQAGA
jgi:CDGSH-type Zn-finger protein